MRSARALAAITSSPSAGLGILLPEDIDEADEEEEDEETLQLKLQEIQARLKLKKLQNARAREQVATQRDSGPNPISKPDAAKSSPVRRSARARTPGADENSRPAPQNEIQIPASPVRKLQFFQQQKSPSRVLLGIDKGLKGKDVSLKRAPNLKGRPSGGSPQSGSDLHRSRSLQPPGVPSERSHTMTFNERLASVRRAEVERTERQQRIQRARSHAFIIGQDEMENYKNRAVDIPDEPLAPPSFTRDEVLARSTPSTSGIPQSNTAPQLHSGHSSETSSSCLQSTSTPDSSVDEQGGEASFEAYSCMHLSRRILPHTVVTRHVSGKKILDVKALLRDVKAPDFSLPDVEQDVVVFAVVGRKSDPRSHQPSTNKKEEERGKYLVITLTDLEYELDLFLFGTGFTRYWKLVPGTVIAILNPSTMPPPPGRQDTGRFSLVINSGDDTILEIGSSRDLGFCQSVRKDGEPCGSWVNKRKTHFCEYHSNEAVRKQRSTRLEVNSTGFGGQARQGRFGSGQRGGKKKASSHYDWETKTHWFAAKSHSAADLIDGKDLTTADKKERAEFVQRNLEAKEKERELMKKLGKIGTGAGREYMEHLEQSTLSKSAPGGKTAAAAPSGPTTTAAATAAGAHDGASTGFFVSKDRTITLSPVKRKRPATGSSQASSTVGSTTQSHASSSSSSTAAAAGYGWGSSLKSKLSKMKDGEKLHHRPAAYSAAPVSAAAAEAADAAAPPVRKKTRFVTEKGIREAGRESLGFDFSEKRIELNDDDDDAELVII